MAKKRNATTVTGNKGVNALHNYCEQNHLIFQGEPREDYGIDCYIEVADENAPKNFIIGVQCKAGSSYKRGIHNDGSFSVHIKVEDLEYWAAANYPVFFVYYDLLDDTLYYKHVQAELKILPIPRVSAFRFTKQDAVTASSNSLADYARNLVSMTPAISDRLEILQNQFTIDVNGTTHRIDSGSSTPGLVSLASALQPEGHNFFCLEESIVLGYSPDDRWILQVLVKHLGGKCTEYSAIFIDTANWSQFRAPIYKEQDHDAEREPSVKDCADNLAIIQEQIDHLNIGSAKTIHHCLMYYSNIDEAPQQNLALCWGMQRFSLACRMLYNRDVLVSENRRFVPARGVHLATAGIGLAALSDIDRELWAEEQKTRMGHIAAICHSASGKILSLETMSNQSNACFGHPELRIFHFRVDELRDLCIDALRV